MEVAKQLHAFRFPLPLYPFLKTALLSITNGQKGKEGQTSLREYPARGIFFTQNTLQFLP
jgi:hypothetical protein